MFLPATPDRRGCWHRCHLGPAPFPARIAGSTMHGSRRTRTRSERDRRGQHEPRSCGDGVGGAVPDSPFAATASAGPSATDVWCTGGGSGDLQAAIDAAQSGDTLRIHGVCVGNFAVPGGGSAPTLFLRGAPLARLDGGGAGTTLIVDRGATLSVSRLKITGAGNVFEGGGIFVSFATLHLSRSTIAGNGACVGAGIAVLGSTATIVHSTVRGNSAGFGSFGCDFRAGGGVEVDLGSTVTVAGSSTIREGRPPPRSPTPTSSGIRLDPEAASPTCRGSLRATHAGAWRGSHSRAEPPWSAMTHPPTAVACSTTLARRSTSHLMSSWPATGRTIAPAASRGPGGRHGPAW
jgi:hypothetical protein